MFYYDTIFLIALQAIFHFKKYKKRFFMIEIKK